jgi:hypothetical protein
MIAVDEDCGWAGSGVKAEICPSLTSVLAGSEGWSLWWVDLLEMNWERRGWGRGWSLWWGVNLLEMNWERWDWGRGWSLWRVNLLEMNWEKLGRDWGRKVEAGFEGAAIKGSTDTSWEASMWECSRNACALRLRLKKNRASRSEMRTNPPIPPPMISSVGFLWMGVEELDGPTTFDVELDELDDASGTLIDIEVLFEDVEDGASCWTK